MTTEATPGALGSNDQLGLVPERANTDAQTCIWCDRQVHSPCKSRYDSLACELPPLDEHPLGALVEAAGMVNILNHGSGSCVHSEGCNGVTQEHLERFAELLLERERERARVKRNQSIAIIARAAQLRAGCGMPMSEALELARSEANEPEHANAAS